MSPSFLPEVLDYQIIVNDALNQINEIKLTPVAYDDEVITITNHKPSPSPVLHRSRIKRQPQYHQ